MDQHDSDRNDAGVVSAAVLGVDGDPATARPAASVPPPRPDDAAEPGAARAGAATTPYAAVRETHSAVVVLIGPWAVKVKKPARLGFLDFSTPELRRTACLREVELNRRLAPDVYVGVGTLQGPSGGAEPLVMMRRMPEERRLSARVRDGGAHDDDVRALARLLADFHSGAVRAPAISRDGTGDHVRELWQRNLEEVARHGDVVPVVLQAEIRERSLRYVAGRKQLFADRVAAGRIVDGHGDLLADDIFVLDDGPRVLDCLEFDDRLRHLDQLDDVACLVMDLERLGRLDLGARLLACYVQFAADPAPHSLVHHYVAYRAFMRAKVACLRRAQAAADPRPPGPSEDPALLAMLAADHLRAAAVRAVLVGGAPGTGKSTVADALGARTGATVLSSDRVRKELAGIGPHTSAAAPFEEGIYGPDWTERTYAELLRRADILVRRGVSVVLDASWRDVAHRRAADRMAAATSTDLVQLRCELDPAVAARRIRGRDDVSDADEHIATMIRALAPEWPDSFAIDTSAEPASVADAALAVLERTEEGKRR